MDIKELNSVKKNYVHTRYQSFDYPNQNFLLLVSILTSFLGLKLYPSVSNLRHWKRIESLKYFTLKVYWKMSNFDNIFDFIFIFSFFKKFAHWENLIPSESTYAILLQYVNVKLKVRKYLHRASKFKNISNIQSIFIISLTHHQSLLIRHQKQNPFHSS